MTKIITITVRSGTVQDVDNLPPGYDYKIIDHDLPEIGKCPKCYDDLLEEGPCECGWTDS